MSKYWVVSGPYIPVFGLNTEIYGVNQYLDTFVSNSGKLYNNKYMIASTPIANIEVFTLTAVLVFTLLSRKFLFINRKDNRDC